MVGVTSEGSIRTFAYHYCRILKITWCGLIMLQAVDVGESMYIHAFGAYFGLAVARVLWTEKYSEARGEGVVYHSDLFSMIGKYLF